MEIKEIKAIIDLMKKNSISEFELEQKDFKIKLKRGSVYTVEENSPLSHLLPPGAARSNPAVEKLIANRKNNERIIKSPMIGTVYLAPSPESPPYVEVGSEVNLDTVVCIIEAMKVMNEIKAEANGVITQMLTENGKPVEFGQPLFKVRPL